MRYEVVDVFAERPLEGNPLTVVVDASDLDAETMQAIARETNHSETTFITGHADDGTPQVRIFTPQTELPFAGHPTLGTAAVAGTDALDLPIGRIPIQREGDLLWMTQNHAKFAPLDDAMISACLGVPVIDANIGSTGTPMAMVEVADSDAVRKAWLRVGGYTGATVACVYVFAEGEGADHDIHARSFGGFVGIKEDPATGSAAGPLAAWLKSQGRLDQERVIHQGIEMKRPSQLHLRGSVEAPQVGGKVQPVAHGDLVL